MLYLTGLEAELFGTNVAAAVEKSVALGSAQGLVQKDQETDPVSSRAYILQEI